MRQTDTVRFLFQMFLPSLQIRPPTMQTTQTERPPTKHQAIFLQSDQPVRTIRAMLFRITTGTSGMNAQEQTTILWVQRCGWTTEAGLNLEGGGNHRTPLQLEFSR